MAVGRVHFPQRGRDQLDIGKLLDHSVDHQEKRVGVQRGPGGNIRTADSEPFLEVLLIPKKCIDVADNSPEHLLGSLEAAGGCPQFGSVVQIE